VALATGIVAWALSWWGGADGIALLALALRHGLPGTMAGALAAAAMGVALMLRRKRSPWRLAAAVSDVLALKPTGEIPADAEMPAAAALAVGGLTMEVITLCRTIFG
jgi:Flp pilus assembly protein protease CpaA